MKIAVIGAGAAGTAIASGCARAGHEVVVSAQDEGHAKNTADRAGGTVAASNPEAARQADLLVLAVPYQAVPEVAAEIIDEVAGKVVIDATNPLKPDYSGLAVTDRAGAELVQELLPKAAVVKAFNTVLSSNQADPVVDGVALDGYLAGDDPAAKRTVAQLLEGIGYRPVDVGPLSLALALEQMAFLNITLNASQDLPWRSGWKLVGPTTS